jgi:hypothetical protein
VCKAVPMSNLCVECEWHNRHPRRFSAMRVGAKHLRHVRAAGRDESPARNHPDTKHRTQQLIALVRILQGVCSPTISRNAVHTVGAVWPSSVVFYSEGSEGSARYEWCCSDFYLSMFVLSVPQLRGMEEKTRDALNGFARSLGIKDQMCAAPEQAS